MPYRLCIDTTIECTDMSEVYEFSILSTIDNRLPCTCIFGQSEVVIKISKSQETNRDACSCQFYNNNNNNNNNNNINNNFMVVPYFWLIEGILTGSPSTEAVSESLYPNTISWNPSLDVSHWKEKSKKFDRTVFHVEIHSLKLIWKK